MTLKTHEDRMAALEYAFDIAHSGTERAQIVQLAAELEHRSTYAGLNNAVGSAMGAAMARGSN